MNKILFCFTALVAASALSAADVNRKRDVIFYHYDMAPVLWPKAFPYSPEAIINGPRGSHGMYGLPAKSIRHAVKPDTIVYVPMANFANLSAMIPSNEPIEHQPTGSTWLSHMKNVIPEIKAQGKANDPISAMSAWARKNKKELLIGLCVNDCHFQGGYNPLKPPTAENKTYLIDNYLFNSFKKKHPNWLMGSQTDNPPLKGLRGNHPRFSSWCAVDYEQQGVRDRFVAIATEIIKGYDIDGVLIDFCRGPCLFRSTAWGAAASVAQCQKITEMLGMISAVAKEKGCLVAVRVPNCLQGCKAAGMDVPSWFIQKFADLLFIGGAEYNRWSTAADMARKCGVPFYATMNYTTIFAFNDEGGREDDRRLRRITQEVYRARVTEARIAGAKGIIYPSGRFAWRQTSCYTHPSLFQPEQEKIRLENKRYFVNYLGGPGDFVSGMGRYRTVPHLHTSSPRAIKGSARYDIYVWDDFKELKRENIVPKCYLTTILEIPSGWTVDVKINGTPLKVIKKRAGSQVYPIPAGLLQYGKNEISLFVGGNNRRGLVPRIGNLGIDVLFKGELEALTKPGNDMIPVKTIQKRSAKGANTVSAKKGGSK